jgi:hypothetical protein
VLVNAAVAGTTLVKLGVISIAPPFMKSLLLPKHKTTRHLALVTAEQSRQQTNLRNVRESAIDWRDRVHSIRAFLWTQEIADEKELLTQFLARVRRLFAADFCFGALFFDREKILEAGLPEAALTHVPSNFSRVCLDLIGSSRTPITLSHHDGCRSKVVCPLSPAVGQPLGFVTLGYSAARRFSSSELFLLQSLAGELGWALKSLHEKKQQSNDRSLVDIEH